MRIIIKSDEEIRKMETTGMIVAEILDRLVHMVEPGMVTMELEEEAIGMIREKGTDSAFLGYRGFPRNICVSVNEEVVHGIPGRRKLQVGDIVSIDIGIRYRGYYGDTAKTVAVGDVVPELRSLIETTERALHSGIAQVSEGNRLGDVSHAIEECVVEKGFSVVREFVGHGIGINMHEDPQVQNFGEPHTGPRLKNGMVFAIEPMVNMGASEVEVLADGWTVVSKDRTPSAHFEHTVAVTKEGPKVLTCLKKNQ